MRGTLRCPLPLCGALDDRRTPDRQAAPGAAQPALSTVGVGVLDDPLFDDRHGTSGGRPLQAHPRSATVGAGLVPARPGRSCVRANGRPQGSELRHERTFPRLRANGRPQGSELRRKPRFCAVGAGLVPARRPGPASCLTGDRKGRPYGLSPDACCLLPVPCCLMPLACNSHYPSR